MAEAEGASLPFFQGRWRYPLLLGLGVFAGLGQAPFGIWPTTLIALALGFQALRASPNIVQAFRIGWVLGTGYFALVLAWIIEPFFVDAARHGWMAPFAILFCAAGFGLFWGWAFGLAQWVAARSGVLWLVFPLCFIGAEIVRGYAWTGFPWALVAYIWSDTPILQWAAWVGPYGLGLLTLLSVTIPMAFAQRTVVLRGLLVLLPFVALFGLGLFRLNADPAASIDRPTIRIVQPNAPQHLKWDPDWVMRFFDRGLALTAGPSDDVIPDLVVWPETSVPFLLHNAGGAFDAILQQSQGAPTVLGIRRVDGRRFFNSLAVIDDDGVGALYDKHHLVPFGEYVPLGWLASKLGIYGLASEEGGGYSAGPGPELLNFGKLGKALPLICYEASFPQDVATTGERPGWLLQITNDAWFGTWSGPYQHLEQARFRAVEQGLPMVRSANTGVSAVIDAKGRITESLPVGIAGSFDAALPSALPPTPYSRTGDGPLALLVLLSLAGLTLRRIGK